MLQINWSSN